MLRAVSVAGSVNRALCGYRGLHTPLDVKGIFGLPSAALELSLLSPGSPQWIVYKSGASEGREGFHTVGTRVDPVLLTLYQLDLPDTWTTFCSGSAALTGSEAPACPHLIVYWRDGLWKAHLNGPFCRASRQGVNRSWLTSTIPDVQLRAKLAVEEREAGVSLTGMVEMKIYRETRVCVSVWLQIIQTVDSVVGISPGILC